MGSIVSQEGAAREGLLLALVMVSLPFSLFFASRNLTRNMEKPQGRETYTTGTVLYEDIPTQKVLHWVYTGYTGKGFTCRFF